MEKKFFLGYINFPVFAQKPAITDVLESSYILDFFFFGLTHFWLLKKLNQLLTARRTNPQNK